MDGVRLMADSRPRGQAGSVPRPDTFRRAGMGDSRCGATGQSVGVPLPDRHQSLIRLIER